ncbi:MAG: DNA-binding protein [Planctomycetes bacterium]|nr:DNA-binding protein [Planctomycetota bacterium]
MPTLRLTTISALAAALLATAGCRDVDGRVQPTTDRTSPPAVGNPHTAAVPTGPTAVVLETMDAGSYTYVRLEVGGVPTWYAGPQVEIAPGEAVLVPDRTLEMRNFRSDALDRTFDVLYLVQSIRKVGVPPMSPEQAVQQAHEAAQHRARNAGETAAVELGDIPKADGGMTVAELFALGKAGVGREVVLRGRVVKSNAGILGRNWLHVRDGSGTEGSNDITVSTGDVAEVGDLVLVRGTLAADRDLGFGYVYELLVEDAAVTIE